MPRGSERKGQILLSAVNRCCLVCSSGGFTPAVDVLPRGFAEPPLKMHLILGVCVAGSRCLIPVLVQAGMASPGVPPLFFDSSPATVAVGFRWHCVAFLTLQHWLCRLLLSLSFCFAALSNSLCISSVDLIELHSDPHLSPF